MIIDMKKLLYFIRLGVRLSFSVVLLQLLYIALHLTGSGESALYAVPEMLEYCAASASLTFAGAYILEYCLWSFDKG